jgi:sugar phosphate isomerase/epimerase
MELGIVSDEIAPGFREAINYGTSWGITKYEIRTLETGRVPNVEGREIQEILDGIRSDGVEISALSPGMFKMPVSNQAEIRYQLDVLLPDTIRMAEKFGTRKLIVFGFQRIPGEASENVKMAVDYLGEAAERASKGGMTLLIENEPGFWCDTGSNTARILREISSPALRANWDPCNAFGLDEEPFPDGYAAVKEFIANVHVKDTRKGALIECVPVGEGLINWRGQLRALLEDQPVEHVTIETHSLPLVEKSKRNVDVLRALLSELKGT